MNSLKSIHKIIEYNKNNTSSFILKLKSKDYREFAKVKDGKDSNSAVIN